MGGNPFKDSTRKTQRAASNTFLDLAVVRQVDANENHTVLVEILSARENDGPMVAAALAPSTSDVSLPNEGDLVVIGRIKGRRPVVLGALHSRENPPRSYKINERHVGRDGGSVHLHGDYSVVPKASSDPQSPPDGAIWYRDDLDEYRGVENGTVVSFDTTAV